MPITIDWQRVLPVLVSIAILIVVAIVRSTSRTAAVILATMPINIPLAMYVITNGGALSEASDRQAFVDFLGGAIIGLIPTFLFMVVAYVTARAGWGFWQVIGAGYLAWGVCLVLVLGIQALLTR
ncbi:MAG: hypothetical protein KME04_09640 [Pleurocapsa minor GSE-CHR-MK-17-07R]|jgi:ABC-type transport system involved in cytochrome bd biosynthesis fused ATPase/permease subunit|nr:hypothetical protein [Pleurocapsa minor GSE-CHR-MK 17-07R]